LDRLNHFRPLVVVLLALWVLGCGENKNIERPPEPPKIALQTIHGMPSDDVFGTLVDTKGRLWISTESGVIMFASAQAPFDVSKATWFTNRDGLPNLRCRGLAELHGKIWVATWGGGVGIYADVLPWKTLGLGADLAANRVFRVAADDTSMWIATAEGIQQYIDDDAIPEANRLVDHSGHTEFGPGVFTSVVPHNDANRGPEVWASERIRDIGGSYVKGGVRVLRFPGSEYFNTVTSGIPGDDVVQIAWDPVRKLFWTVHPENGVASLDVDAKVWTNYTMVTGLVSDLANSIAITNLGTHWTPGTIWVATQEGLTKIKPGGAIVNYVDGSGLPSLRVRTVYVDATDNVWLGFVDGGAAKVVPAQ